MPVLYITVHFFHTGNYEMFSLLLLHSQKEDTLQKSQLYEHNVFIDATDVRLEPSMVKGIHPLNNFRLDHNRMTG